MIRATNYICIGVSTLLAFLFLPDGFWFLKLWVGASIGLFTVICIEISRKLTDGIPFVKILGFGTTVSIQNSMLFKLVAGTIFLVVSCLGLIPQMIIEDAEARLLRSAEIELIELRPKNSSKIVIIDGNRLKDIEKYFSDLSVFYPTDRDPGEYYFDVYIKTNKKDFYFQGMITERRSNDVRLSFNSWFYYSKFLVPNIGVYLKRK